MLPVLSRQQMRRFDQHAIEQCRVPGVVLMENAGRGASESLLRRIEKSSKVLIVSGPGNNGGDGFVVARHLLREGISACVVLAGDPTKLSGDARVNCDAWLGLGGQVHVVEAADAAFSSRLESSDVVVDALFGTGLTRAVEGELADLIRAIDASSARVFALDIPSGLDADTGQVLGVALRADATFTFAHLKLGLLSAAARPFVGELEVVDIGVPGALFERVGASAWCTEQADVRATLSKLAPPSHKGEAGKVCVVAGSPDTLGAARLCAHGALRAGAGLVKIATFPPAADALQASNWEVMTSSLDTDDPMSSLEPLLEWADAFVVGPGFGLGEPQRTVTSLLLSRARRPVVLDADGLTHFAGQPEELKACSSLLITPHPAEAGRLLESSAADVERDRFAALRALQATTGATVLLKGPRTLVGSGAFDDGLPRVNASGSAALATAGSGDVLSGMLGALCCRLPAHEAAVCGAWLHGRCAERWSQGTELRGGMLAREIADQLPYVLWEA